MTFARPKGRARPCVYIVGAGAVGLGLALALRHVGCEVTGVWNRRAPGRRRAERLLRQRADGPRFGPGLTRADIVLVAVADNAIAEVGARLRATRRLKPGAIVAHTSGCMSAAELGDLGIARRASLHPLVPLPDPESAAKALLGATYALEGDDRALPQLRSLVARLDGRAVRIHAREKARYHAAAVLASNLVVALLAEAIAEGRVAGLSIAHRALGELAAAAVDNVVWRGPGKALTGPIRRGDDATVARHLAALSPQAREIYRLLSLVALSLAESSGLAPSLAKALRRLLTSSTAVGRSEKRRRARSRNGSS